MKPEPFLDFAHDIDVSGLLPDQALGQAIEKLPGRKLIFTNGSEAHARNVAGRLGIIDHFEAVFDIIAADFTPKPEESTYLKCLERHQIDPARATMFEDLEQNLLVPHQLGMRTVLIQPKHYDIYREAEEQADSIADYVHFKTKDLTGFLRELI